MDPDAYLVTITGTGAPASPMPLASAGLRLAHSQDGLSVWVSGGPAPLHVTLIAPSTVLIGEVYASRSHSDGVADPFDAASLAGLGVVAMAERLIDQAWGRFVLVGHRPQAAAFRDPSGALDCVTWRTGPHRFFSGRLPRDLDPLLPAAISIDWSVVADQLCDPLAVSGASGLRNLVAIAPGSLWISTTVGPGEAKQLWRPAELAHRVQDAAGDPRRALHDSVQTCVATLAQPYCRRLVEISGGLDSAIVAAALHGEPGGHEVPTRWINYVPGEAEGDERLYARAVAAKHGFELTERLRAPLRYDEAGLAEVGADFRIGLTALDPDYDADLEAEALAFDAGVVITGQGGDAVFLQMATGDALADRLRLQGQIDLAVLLAHSRRWRRSLWRTLGDTVRRTVWSAPHRRQLRPFLAGAQGHKAAGPSVGRWPCEAAARQGHPDSVPLGVPKRLRTIASKPRGALPASFAESARRRTRPRRSELSS